ncbi:MAG: glycosyltransferase [Chitinophagales bacterium]
MIWLASFPRSGNTFFRNVLFEVYGIESSEFHQQTAYSVAEDYDQYQVVKTHLLPHQVESIGDSIKSVYLVRDGRDSLVSLAHHRKDIMEPNSDFQINLLEAVIASKGSFFGGWSENVRQWKEKADVIIHFEDLISDPIGEVEKLRSIIDLPQPKRDKLPSFEDLKFGQPKYSLNRKSTNPKKQKERIQKFFRKGKVGSWKEEMSPEMEQLFWSLHGEVMTEMGYEDKKPKSYEGFLKPSVPYRVLIEANKLFIPERDGIKRYLFELLDNLAVLQDKLQPKWEIDLYCEGKIIQLEGEQKGLKEVVELIEVHNELQNQQQPYETRLLAMKTKVQKALPTAIYQSLSWFYKNLPIRYLLRKYRENIIQRKNFKNQPKFDNYDLVHIPLPQNFFHLKDVKQNFLVTVHDLTHKYFPEFHTKENILNAEAGMQETIKKEAHILAVTKASKKDVLKTYPTIKSEQVSVVHEACNRNHFKPLANIDQLAAILKKYQLPNTPYFLTLSTLEPRKNLLNTIKAFQKLVAESEKYNLSLFICGKNGWKNNELLEKDHLLDKNIFFTGFIDEEDLPILYSHALALCYVSFYEGFGLPPLEAMSCGTTVIYGNNSSMPEVIGEAGLAADPSDMDDIKNQMKKLLLNDEYRKDLEKKAIQRSYQFSWLKMAWETLCVYEKVIQKNKANNS